MSINIAPADMDELRPRIVVIGVGGAGGNAITNMIDADIEGVDFVYANTDAQALNSSVAETRIQLGPELTKGLGAGARPEVGRAAAEETIEEIEKALEGVNMVFIAAGMGGGTGTGAAPVIAETARKMGILTVGVVTKPFLFEGTRRMRSAEQGIDQLQDHVDTLIVIPNQNLFLVAKAETTFKEAFQLADEVLQQGVRSITDLMVMPGLINLDFADIRSVMQEMGKAMMGTGESEGESRALEAAEMAIANPLLDGVSMQGARGVIISIIGGEDMRLLEVDEAANHIRELVDPDANIIWGSAFNPDLEGKIRVSVVATGIDGHVAGAHDGGRAARTPSPASRVPEPVKKEPVPEPEITYEAPEPQEASPEPVDAGFGDSPLARRGEAKPVDDLDTNEGFDGGDDYSGASDDAVPPPADDSGYTAPGEDHGFSDDDDEPLDLSLDFAEDEEGEDDVNEDAYADLTGGGLPRMPKSIDEVEDEGEDELLLDASRLAENRDDEAGTPSPAPEPAPSAADGLGGTSAGGAPAQPSGGPPVPGGGSTLFERMANLSRGGGKPSSEPEKGAGEDEEEDDNGAVNIPRFLGRQNNQ
ncbi:cell division protein FtsZ [Blastomonas marina]|uniref:cell division protein FtsZ n=1 Tax=Blastomonas marina TaxID=1867408 RepID=UPI002AC9CD8E|nr:cell division protein FtsZ [Blastomonas marina]WPZ02780.1 cell division protein FtsZ [Blastomonas marina]